jgi:tRNA1Val (adenine37-N6)-methyltransferase
VTTPPVTQGETLVTHGALLGGRVRYAQPAEGFRSGIEPVLLAASVPARAGERVLEAGTGAGAALLCLATRVPGLSGLGVERDPALAALAAANLRANDVTDISIEPADLCAVRLDGFDHAFANPPYHAPAGTASPLAGRDSAKRAMPGLVGRWVGALAGALRHRGTLTLVLPAGLLPEASAAAAAAGCGSGALFPLWPRAGAPAKLVLLRWVRGGKGPFRVAPGLVLHGTAGFTPEAQAVLREGTAISF